MDQRKITRSVPVIYSSGTRDESRVEALIAFYGLYQCLSIVSLSGNWFKVVYIDTAAFQSLCDSLLSEHCAHLLRLQVLFLLEFT